MIGRLYILQKRKDLGRKLTTEELLEIFQEHLSLRSHVLIYWENHLDNFLVKTPEEIPVLAIIEMLDLSFQDQQVGIQNITHARINRSAFKSLWKIFREDVDSVLTRKDLLKNFPGLLTIETDYQNETLSDNEKKAIRIFNRLENNQIIENEIKKNAIFILEYAPDHDIKKAVKVILHEKGIKITS